MERSPRPARGDLVALLTLWCHGGKGAFGHHPHPTIVFVDQANRVVRLEQARSMLTGDRDMAVDD
jgi:hypothetical protein